MYYKLKKDCIRFSAMDIEMLGNPRTQSLFGLDEKGALLADELLKGVNVNIEYITESEQALINALHRNRQFTCSEQEKLIRVAYFHVTTHCNMNCPGCYSGIEKNTRADLSFDEMKKIVANMALAHVGWLIFSGGEPFLYSNIIELLKYTKQIAGIPYVCCITNGLADYKTYVEACQYLDDLSFSLDGFSEESSYFRRKSHNKVVDSIKRLTSMGNTVSIIFTIHKQNLGNIAQMKKLAQTLGVSYNFSLFTAYHSSTTEAYVLNNDDFSVLENILTYEDVVIKDTSINNEISCRDCCGAGSMELSVAANGDVFPCHMFFDNAFCMGNALKDDLNTLFLEDKPMFHVDQKSECSKCEYRYICGGGCLFRSYILRGHLEDTDPLCPLYTSRIEKILSDLIG